jgi:hypothetical protein
VPQRSSYRRTPFWKAYTAVTQFVDQHRGWDRLPVPFGLLVLIGLRTKLRQENLTDLGGVAAENLPPLEPPSAEQRARRTADGSYNDLRQPRMGMAGSRFGRNIPAERIVPATPAEVMTPNPREVSLTLLTRDEFVPAPTVNSLVAAWLQFMIRDWLSHGTSPTDNPWVIPLHAEDSWPERPMHIMRTRDDPTRPPGTPGPQTRVNVLSPWWDGSQIYGVDAADQRQRRSGVDGKLRVLDNGMLPRPQDPAQDPSRVPGFWLGLALMQTLFTLEHNAICDKLRATYPAWDDEEIFQRARLVNAALLAKIHTIEWTPAVISHPTTKVALRANWFGLAGERLHRLFGRISKSEVISGIPGGATDHYGVPYSLTEEFVAVYRMHPLMRDDWDMRSVVDDRPVGQYTLRQLAGPNVFRVLDEVSMPDLFYSFGRLPPGLVTLHNFPRNLQEFERPDGHYQDLAATDILRSREMGVPRYNEFRRLLHLRPARDFESLTDNPRWAAELRRVYDGDIERVDLTVGMFAEPLPKGFAFSDTAFRIFILMASRRLNSDRFFTEYYTPAVYTQVGMDWIADNSMVTVLLRHYPSLRAPMLNVVNAFQPWAASAR